MALFFQQNINPFTKLAVWRIEEPEPFFHLQVPLRDGISHPHKRLQHLAGRYLLPYLFTDFPNEEIEIADTRKPFLPNEQYHFSISHCKDFAAAIVSAKERVGIDVEYVTNRVEKIKNKFLHADELRFVNSRPISFQLRLLTVLWCAKEAMFKWYGNGEVDFSEMLRIAPFELQQQGLINSYLVKEDYRQILPLQYKFLDDLVMVWVHTS